MYTVFTRNWWKSNSAWPGGREPGAGRKYTLYRNLRTEEEARRICKQYNATHKPGKLSHKAEYDEQ